MSVYLLDDKVVLVDGSVATSEDCCCAPTGACCVDTDCSIQTESDCTDAGGTYQGDDTGCDPNPCAGAGCCPGNMFTFFFSDPPVYFLQQTTVLTQEAHGDCPAISLTHIETIDPETCEYSDVTILDPDPFPAGCEFIGSCNGPCSDFATSDSEAFCTEFGETKTCTLSSESTCPTGACCVGEDCSIKTEFDCTDAGGTYQGDDIPCDPNPCLPSCPCGFPAFDGSGRQFLTHTVLITRSYSSPCNDLGCNSSLSLTYQFQESYDLDCNYSSVVSSDGHYTGTTCTGEPIDNGFVTTCFGFPLVGGADFKSFDQTTHDPDGGCEGTDVIHCEETLSDECNPI